MQNDSIGSVPIWGFIIEFSILRHRYTTKQSQGFCFVGILLSRKSSPGGRRSFREAMASMGWGSRLELLQEVPWQIWVASECPHPSTVWGAGQQSVCLSGLRWCRCGPRAWSWSWRSFTARARKMMVDAM